MRRPAWLTRRRARGQPGPDRRRLIALGVSVAFAPALAGARECDVCAVDAPSAGDFEFAQPGNPSPPAFMQVAMQARDFAARRGDPAFGAAVVLGDLVLGAGPNRTVSRRDPSAHAEIEAIRDACRRLDSARLDGAVMYASSRPCRMCEIACYYAGVARIVHGESLSDAGAPRYEAC